MTQETVAAILFVRDEANDIAGWLAWYQMLGFDACIVYDDGSTDGTRELLEAASLAKRVIVRDSVGDRDVLFIDRQRRSYLDALERYAAFDWLFFVDADEYISLYRHDDIHDFLADYAEADGIGVNWCNYGSSGHILKPKGPAVLAYLWHTAPDAPPNVHVKSFVRPRRLGPNWLNVHAYDVAPDRYVTADHRPIRWGNIPGLIATTPDWSVAKLMHYQCRSMEHFVDRVRKRPDLSRSIGEWQAYDRNDIEDRYPLRFAETLPHFDVLTNWNPLAR